VSDEVRRRGCWRLRSCPGQELYHVRGSPPTPSEGPTREESTRGSQHSGEVVLDKSEQGIADLPCARNSGIVRAQTDGTPVTSTVRHGGRRQLTPSDPAPCCGVVGELNAPIPSSGWAVALVCRGWPRTRRSFPRAEALRGARLRETRARRRPPALRWASAGNPRARRSSFRIWRGLGGAVPLFWAVGQVCSWASRIWRGVGHLSLDVWHCFMEGFGPGTQSCSARAEGDLAPVRVLHNYGTRQ